MLLQLDPHPQSIHIPTAMMNITPTQLRKAADLQEKIQSLQKELAQLLGGPVQPATKAPKKRKMSAAGRAAIAAAARARWAKIKAAKGKAVQQPKRKLTAAAKARLSALAKARWAKVKAQGKARL